MSRSERPDGDRRNLLRATFAALSRVFTSVIAVARRRLVGLMITVASVLGASAPPSEEAPSEGSRPHASLAVPPSRVPQSSEPGEASEAWWPDGITVTPPPQPVVYEDWVDRALAELIKPGRLLFNPPHRMQLNQKELVEVRLIRSLGLDAELRKDLEGHGEPELRNVKTTPVMAVTLKG
jgi:hypothetical protein